MSWRDEAACIGEDARKFTELAWTKNGGPREFHDWALFLCKSCPVRLECLLDEVNNNEEPLSIRGGARPPEIRALRRIKLRCSNCKDKLDTILSEVDRAVSGEGSQRWRCSLCRESAADVKVAKEGVRKGGPGGPKGEAIARIIISAGPSGLTVSEVSKIAMCSVGRVYEVTNARDDLIRVSGRIRIKEM